jgi:hypothetical protein
LKAFFDLVRRVVESFGAVGLDYMFTGALAASYYGVPRTTMDVDVVVEVTEEEARSKLVSALKQAGLVVDGERIDAAIESGYGIVTFRDAESPYNVDVIVSDRKLERRAGTILGLATFYQSPEDLILAKLRMIKATVPRERALKDEDDVKAILRFTEVDIGVVKEGARRGNTLPILEGIVGGSFKNDES